MKVVISLPHDLFRPADQLARRLGLSRSELYARAVAEYLARYRHADVTARLYQLYGTDPSGVEPSLRAAQTRSVESAEW